MLDSVNFFLAKLQAQTLLNTRQLSGEYAKGQSHVIGSSLSDFVTNDLTLQLE